MSAIEAKNWFRSLSIVVAAAVGVFLVAALAQSRPNKPQESQTVKVLRDFAAGRGVSTKDFRLAFEDGSGEIDRGKIERTARELGVGDMDVLDLVMANKIVFVGDPNKLSEPLRHAVELKTAPAERAEAVVAHK
jgi:hypothetical protein